MGLKNAAIGIYTFSFNFMSRARALAWSNLGLHYLRLLFQQIYIMFHTYQHSG